MTVLALRSLRHRSPAFLATFLSAVAGTALIGSFATLLETSFEPIPTGDQEMLTIMGGVVGSWGTVVVLFSLASTLGITVGQRDVEIATLRTIGATPRQARRMIRVETVLVAVAGSALGAVAAWFGGRALLALIREAGMVSESVRFAGGPAALGATVALILATSLVSATLAGRKATAGPVRLAMAGAPAARMRWWRVLAAVVLLGYGAATAALTVFVMADSEDPYAAMQTSGASSILVGVGLALLAPVLLRWIMVLARPVLSRLGGPGHLAAFNASRRSQLLSGILAPVIVLSAASIGTLTLVSIDARSLPDGVAADETELITMLNNVVVGMISLFAAIMVINSFAAVISHRRAELARLRLLGATPGQVRNSVLVEAAVVAAVGVVLGSLAALTTIVPFAVARDEGLVPDGGLWLGPALAGATVVLTLVSAAVAVRRATADPALAAASQ